MTSWLGNIFNGEENKKDEQDLSKGIHLQTASREDLVTFIRNQSKYSKDLYAKVRDLETRLLEEQNRLHTEQDMRVKMGFECEEHEKKIEKLNKEVEKFSVMLDVEIVRTKTSQDRINLLEQELAKYRQKEEKNEAIKSRLKTVTKAQLSATIESERAEKWKTMEHLQAEKIETEKLREKIAQLESEKTESKSQSIRKNL